MQSAKQPSRIILFFVGVLFLCAMIFLCKGDLHLWHQSGADIFPFIYWRRILLGSGLLLALICLKQRNLLALPSISTGIFGLLLVFCSDWLDTPYSILRGPSIRGEILLGAVIIFILLKRGQLRLLEWLGPLSALGLLITILLATQDRLIFSDDHPVFLQRLILLKENFPWIPFYNPLWNAGIDQRDFFATGALGVFLVLAPLVYTLDVSQYYSQLIAILLFIIIPASTAYAAYRYQRSRLLCSFTIILTLSNSLLWYRWALKYGTVGFLLSSSLVPLVLILANQFLDRNTRFSLKDGALLLIFTTLMLFWSPTALVFAPLGILGLIRLPHILTTKNKLITTCALLLINIAWMSIFVSVSRVGSYVGKETTALRRVAYAEASVEEGQSFTMQLKVKGEGALKAFRDWASAENPLILMLCLPGIILVTNPLRRVLGITFVWTLILGTFGSVYLPQLELDRMLLIGGLIVVMPVSLVLKNIIDNFHHSSGLMKVLSGLTFGFLFASPFATATILINRSVEHYDTARPIVKQLAEAIKEFGGSGRTVFAGFILHELSGGHIAPLVFWSGKELVASSHVHDKWQYTNVLPESFVKKGDAGVEEFLDLMNASAVVAHESKWVKFFRERPEKYLEKWHLDRFYIFERKQQSASFFIAGAGSITQVRTNGITLTTQTPEVILKYRYYPFLRSSACQIAAYQIEELSFIKLSGCPINSPLEISAKTAWHRVGG
jgi:hypothetical protein